MQRDNTDELIKARVMLAPIAASMGRKTGFHAAAPDQQAEKDAQLAAMEVAAAVLTALLSTAESLRTIARVLEAEHEGSSVDGMRG